LQFHHTCNEQTGDIVSNAMLEPAPMRWICAAACQAATVLAFVYCVALLASRALTRSSR
jgi:hypothetical protein